MIFASSSGLSIPDIGFQASNGNAIQVNTMMPVADYWQRAGVTVNTLVIPPQRDSDRGRGLDLIRALMDMVEVEPGDDGTVVRMRKRLAAPVAAPAATASTAPGSSPM